MCAKEKQTLDSVQGLTSSTVYKTAEWQAFYQNLNLNQQSRLREHSKPSRGHLSKQIIPFADS